MKRGIYLILVLFVIVTITGVALAVKPENPGDQSNDPITALWNAVNALQDAVNGLQANDTAQETKIVDLQTIMSALWGNATQQQTAIENEVGARTGDIQALWTNASEQQSAIDYEETARDTADQALWANASEQQSAMPKVVIVKGSAQHMDIIYPPKGFTTSDCDIIIRPEHSITLEYGVGDVTYIASGLLFYADEEFGERWRIHARINYHAENDQTQTQESDRDIKYTVICPCTTVNV